MQSHEVNRVSWTIFYHKAHIIWPISYGCFETITVPRWFKSSMAHKAAIHHLLFWLFAGYLFWKSHSAKCFFGAMRKSFEMILKSFFSVWLWKDYYNKDRPQEWHWRPVRRTLIQSSFLKITNTLPGTKPILTNGIIIYCYNIKSKHRCPCRSPWKGPGRNEDEVVLEKSGMGTS